MKALFYIVLMLTTSALFGQKNEDQNKLFRGTWLKVGGEKDTLKFYLDNNGVDFAIVGVTPENNHGYYLTFLGDSIHIEGMCVGDQGKKFYKLDKEKKELTIQDFYNKTNDRFIFKKISDKVW